MLFTGKTIVLGITGGIAAYKMPNVAHALVKLGADVHVLMTKNATEFISPLVLSLIHIFNPPFYIHRQDYSGTIAAARSFRAFLWWYMARSA